MKKKCAVFFFFIVCYLFHDNKIDLGKKQDFDRAYLLKTRV